jgi:hypothetical protein
VQGFVAFAKTAWKIGKIAKIGSRICERCDVAASQPPAPRHVLSITRRKSDRRQYLKTLQQLVHNDFRDTTLARHRVKAVPDRARNDKVATI